MKKKLLALILISVLAISGVFLLTSCDGAPTEEVLDTFVDDAGLHFSLIKSYDAAGQPVETVHVTGYTGEEGDIVIVEVPNEITIGGSLREVKIIDDLAFSQKDIWRVNVAEGIETIGNFAFAYSKVQRVDLPSTTKSIGEYAFVNCNNLKILALPALVPPELGGYAFKTYVSKDNVYRVSAALNISVPIAVADVYRTTWSEYAGIINR